jgi:Cof subfamily protein (haloacid dehalogenase superfamily)
MSNQGKLLQQSIHITAGAKMTIKLVIADVDGTLVTSTKVLTPRTREAVARLRERGVRFTLTSGRPPRGMAKIVEALGLTEPIAAFNGGVYVKSDLKTVLLQRTLPRPVAQQVVDHLLERGLDVWVYQAATWYVRRFDAFRVDRERSNVGFDPVVIDDLHSVLDEPVKIVGVSRDHALVAQCEAELTARLGAEAAAARSQPYYLDVTHPEANKGMVVREAARILQLPLSDVASIGDMANDVPMLEVAGVGIAMGNAAPEVQRAARHVTLSNDADGFAHAVDTFILGDPELSAGRTRLGLPPRTRACLFALEGVVAPTGPLRAAAWKQLFDHYLRERAHATGQPFIPFDAVRDYGRYFDGRPAVDEVRAFVRSRGVELSDSTLAALVERHATVLAERLGRERVEAYEGAARYLDAVRAAGLKTAIVCAHGVGDALLAATGLRHRFDVKADDPVAAALAVGVQAKDTAVFDDELTDIDAARREHFGYIVAVDHRDHGAELRRHGADAVVSDLSELLSEAA